MTDQFFSGASSGMLVVYGGISIRQSRARLVLETRNSGFDFLLGKVPDIAATDVLQNVALYDR